MIVHVMLFLMINVLFSYFILLLLLLLLLLLVVVVVVVVVLLSPHFEEVVKSYVTLCLRQSCPIHPHSYVS